jgi:hypothetical protein
MLRKNRTTINRVPRLLLILTQPHNPDKAQPSGKKTIPWRKVLKVLEGVGIFAGIFYAVVSYYMWQAMLNANKLAALSALRLAGAPGLHSRRN